jgi:hypothetical protein
MSALAADEARDAVDARVDLVETPADDRVDLVDVLAGMVWLFVVVCHSVTSAGCRPTFARVITILWIRD